jgi:hypothetical protein
MKKFTQYMGEKFQELYKKEFKKFFKKKQKSSAGAVKIQDAPCFDETCGLAAFLTDWCFFFLFFVWSRPRQQGVSVAPFFSSAPSARILA